MKVLKYIFQFILAAIVLASILPHLFPDFWLTDIFSHFKLQYVIILVLILLPYALVSVRRKLLPVILIIIIIIWNASFIVPLYIQNRTITENSGSSLSILSMNLLASNTNYSEALELIREKDPDIIILLELSPQWNLEIEKLYTSYPFQLMHPQTNNFGIGILSRIPLMAKVSNLGKGFPPSIFGKLQVNGHPLSLLATHPVPPVSQEKFKFRNMQLEEISRLSNAQTGNFILVGDLNTSSFSSHFQNLIKKGDLKDSRNGWGIATSWPSDLFILRTTLDHILYKGEMQVITRTTEKNIGSDHLPVYMQIGF